MLSDNTFHELGGLEEYSSNSEEEEEERDEEMVDQGLYWMNQGPISLPGFLHKMSKHLEKLLTKYDLD